MMKRGTDEKTLGSNSPECPKCGYTKSLTIDTRVSLYLGFDAKRRRVQCSACKYKFTTYELAEESLKKWQEQVLVKATSEINELFEIKLVPK